eukprot:1597-Heterococcus_DN1.PRE.1
MLCTMYLQTTNSSSRFSALMDRVALSALPINEIVDECVAGLIRLLLARQQTPSAHRPRPCLCTLAVCPVNVSCKIKLTCKHQPRAGQCSLYHIKATALLQDCTVRSIKCTHPRAVEILDSALPFQLQRFTVCDLLGHTHLDCFLVPQGQMVIVALKVTKMYTLQRKQVLSQEQASLS